MLFDWGDERRPRPRTTKEEKEYFHTKQRGKCMYCGAKLRAGDGHIDHKMPLVRDGKSTLTNKQLLCGPCNNRKGSKTDGEFRRLLKDLLLPARPGKGPPAREIKLERFEAIGKAAAAKRAKTGRNAANEWVW